MTRIINEHALAFRVEQQRRLRDPTSVVLRSRCERFRNPMRSRGNAPRQRPRGPRVPITRRNAPAPARARRAVPARQTLSRKRAGPDAPALNWRGRPRPRDLPALGGFPYPPDPTFPPRHSGVRAWSGTSDRARPPAPPPRAPGTCRRDSASVRALPYPIEHMFQSFSNRGRAWLDRAETLLTLVDDLLGDPPAAAPPHPHRHELRWNRTRRAGAVPAPPAHCLCPVRASPATARDGAAR
jgi:hypothetical protein